MNDNIAIKIENLSKKYLIGRNISSSLRSTLASLWKQNVKEEFWALKDIDLTINKGDAIGIVGNNGAGKSTLLKILSKITQPTTGKVLLNGKVASLLEVGTGFHHELTGRENIYLNGSLLGMKKREIQNKIDEIIDFSGVEKFIDTPVKHYSSGMYVRLAFSVAAHLNTDILLVDEVLAVGDVEFQKKCLGKMEDISLNSGKTVILISHNMKSISNLCSKSILLEKGQIKQFSETKKVINQYLGNEVNLLKLFERGPLKSVEVSTLDNIQIIVEYDFDYDVIIPHFGFIITDENGYNVLGTNPSYENVQLRDFNKTGKIVIDILNPIVLGGTYYLSVWFGNGVVDEVIEKNIIKFEITEDPRYKMGFIKPNVKYSYFPI